MQYTPFEDIATELNAAFGDGLTQAIANGLSAVSGPLTSVVVLWIIVQGVLVMRGDLDTRSSLTKIIRLAIVFGLLTSSGLYNNYVVTTFQTTMPNWIAASVSGGPSIGSTPQVFDKIWNTAVHEITTVQAQVNFYDVVDEVSLALIAIATNLLLVVTFAVYEISQVMIGIIVAIGPFILVAYLFEATRRVAENWVGKLIGLTILTLLVNIVVSAILAGEERYMQAIVNNPATGAGAVPVEVQILFELCMFLGISAFIVVLLPGIAAAIGGGIGFDVGRAVRVVTGSVAVVTRR